MIKQGFFYPGNEMNHHKFFFAAKSPQQDWPRQFKSVDKGQLKSGINKYFSILEQDLNTDYQRQIISTEYLFISDKTAIHNVIKYLKEFFQRIVVFLFVRNPIDYYRSMQQQMIKARSYVASPRHFRYIFKAVIEAWGEYCDVQVMQYDKDIDTCRTFCNKTEIDFNRFSQTNVRRNFSGSIEQMILLEKIQRTVYRNHNSIFKPHFNTILQINAPFTSKPKLQNWVKPIIYKNHHEDMEWLKEEYGINFLDNSPSYRTPSEQPFFEDGKASVRDIYQADEQSAERYEALCMDALLRKVAEMAG